MVICGLKLTHDGAVALIDNGKLIFCYEMEKLNNNKRFASLTDFYSPEFVEAILNEHGYSMKNVDRLVIDGWGDHSPDNPSVEDYPEYKTRLMGKNKKEFEITLNGYGLLLGKDEDILKERSFSYPENDLAYTSYLHVSGHVASGYCTSPFAHRQEDSFVLSWDGGMFPQLFYVSAKQRSIENLGPLFHLLGISYSAFAANYKPYNHLSPYDVNIAGKLMAYIALGKCRADILAEFKRQFAAQEKTLQSGPKLKSKELIALTSKLLSELVIYGEINDVESVDMLATFHVFIQDILLEELTRVVSKYPSYTRNFCFVGGCALNIKWNSNIRNSGLFSDMWVPPFPNDSGSAVGAACCEMIRTGQIALSWDVYTGPQIHNGQIEAYDWDSMDFSVKELAALLHSTNEPVVFLNGRAELGPRALGNRSILAAPVTAEMKATLNRVKKREDYRPVAPICMEEAASGIFTPGSPDPLMLYDHMVKDEWKDKIPAVCHLDGTARLQTINAKENPVVYELLGEYKKLSGIPLLCNTSANLNGSGFFPDVASAMKWNAVDMVWSEGKLFVKRETALHKTCMAMRQVAAG